MLAWANCVAYPDGQVVKEAEVEYGAPIEKPADPQKDTYTFIGWTPEVPATVPGEDMTFTAQWKVNQYAIIYMLNGQEWARDVVNYGTAITLREYTPVADETFSGWTFEDGETYTTMPAHDVTVIGTITTSIQDVLKNHESVDVYDLRGRLMRRDIPVKDLRKVLRTGVYIINGRKVVIK